MSVLAAMALFPPLLLCSRRGRRRGLASKTAAAGTKAYRPSERSQTKPRWEDLRFYRPEDMDRDKSDDDDPEERDTKFVKKLAKFLDDIGGVGTIVAIKGSFPGFTSTDIPKLYKHFDVDDKKAREGDWTVKLRRKQEFLDFIREEAVRCVFKRLMRMGGSDNLANICRRWELKKDVLLDWTGGSMFEEEGENIKLKGGNFLAAQAAVKTGALTSRAGRRTSRRDLMTSGGLCVDRVAEARLKMRIEALVASAGDGFLETETIYQGLGLRPSHALRRWFQKTKFTISSVGILELEKKRLDYFRIRRAIDVSSILMETHGEALHTIALARVHRPAELAAIEQEENDLREADWHGGGGRPRLLPPGSGGGPQQTVGRRRGEVEEDEEEGDLAGGRPALPLYAESLSRATMLRPPGGGFGNPGIDVELNDERYAWWANPEVPPGSPPETAPGNLKLALIRPPEWVEVWVRTYFHVSEDRSRFSFPEDKAINQLVLRNQMWDKGTDPLTRVEQEAMLQDIDEEIRLRYGRCPISFILSTWKSSKKKWLELFYDVTKNGEALEKHPTRQIQEAIQICRKIMISKGTYTVSEAFKEYGATLRWLRKFFVVDEHECIALDADAVRKWTPPEELKPPDVRSLYRLTMPSGFLRRNNHPSGHRKFKRGSGGVLM